MTPLPRGSLWNRGINWFGRYPIDRAGRRIRKIVRIGPVASIPEAEARKKLSALIEHDYKQQGFICQVGVRTAPPEAIEKSAFSVGRAAMRSGEVAEMLVSVHLIGQGLDVYRAINRDAKCDLIAVSSAGTMRIEVKRASIAVSGRIDCEVTNFGFFDVLAVVDDKGCIFYIPALELNPSLRPKISAAYLDVFATQRIPEAISREVPA